MLVQVTRDKIFFSDLQNSFLDFAANLGFVNYPCLGFTKKYSFLLKWFYDENRHFKT